MLNVGFEVKAMRSVKSRLAVLCNALGVTWVEPLLALAMWIVLAPLSAYCAPPDALPESPTLGEIHLGWNGVYKLGCWTPLEVEAKGTEPTRAAQITVTAPDTDGVPTTISKPANVAPGQTNLVRMFVRVGQAQSTVEVRLLAEDGTIFDQRLLNTNSDPEQGAELTGLPATCRLLLVFGSPLEMDELKRGEMDVPKTAATRILHTNRAEDLPEQWYGYEGIDTMVLTTSQPEVIRPLLENSRQMAALRQWVQLGGKLVVFCGSSAKELLIGDGPLSPLVPGRYSEMLPLRQSTPLELFIGSERSIRGRFKLDVPRLADVQGHVLAFAGREEASLPLVVRSRLGFGELTFVALDFDRAPLAAWRGRTSFLRRVLDWPALELSQQQARLHANSEGDLTGRLRTALDAQFGGVSTASFALVAVLIVAYIGLIGPGDYFLLKKLLRRMELTWITFPLTLILVSAGAYWLAHTMKGDELRVNQLEIIDIDSTSGLARGTVWTHFFNPRVSQFDLEFSPRYSGNSTIEDAQALVSWQGLTGFGLGAMQSGAVQATPLGGGYTFGNTLDTLQHLPVEAWSTKTLAARWTANVEQGIQAELLRVSEEVVTGQITNSLGVDLEECLLLYGNWAFSLTDLASGESVSVDDVHAVPHTVKVALTGAKAGDQAVTRTGEDGTVPFNHRRTDVARIAKAMMFYRSMRGQVYTNLVHRYQPHIDLSRILADGQAILLARCPTPGSHWTHGGQPLGGDEDRHWTYYRFILPVRE